MNLDKVGQDLDRLAALAGVPLCVALIVYGLVGLYHASPADVFFYVIFGSVGLASCVIWLRVRNASSLKDLSFPSHRGLFLLANSLFFFSFGCAVLALHLRPEVYVRPLAYFVFVALAVTAIALEILACDSQTKSISLILVEIMLAGFLLQISELILYPNVVGIDPWAHEQFTLQILQLGHLPTTAQYPSTYTVEYHGLPLFHLRVASTYLLSNLDYKWSVALSVGIGLVIIGTLFIFLLGKSLINVKAGLLGALLLVTADYFINFGFWTIPNTLGGILLLVGLYMLLKTPQQNRIGDFAVIAIILTALIMEHNISALAMAVISFSGLAALFIYTKLNQQTVRIYLSFGVAVTFTVAMLAYWAIATSSLNLLNSLLALSSAEAFSATFGSFYTVGVPLTYRALLAAGESVFFGASIIGCLYMISRRFGNPKAFILVFAGLIPFVIGYSRAFELWLVPERWVFFAEILYAVPLALALLIVCSLFRGIKARSLVLATTVMVLTVVMILCPVANIDQNLGIGAVWPRYSLTSSELTAVNTVAHKSSLEILGEPHYVEESYNYYYPLAVAKYPLVVAHQNNSTNGFNEIFLVRAADNGGSSYIVGSFYGTLHPYLVFTPGRSNTTELGPRIYDSGSVTGYENSNTTYNSLLGVP